MFAHQIRMHTTDVRASPGCDAAGGQTKRSIMCTNHFSRPYLFRTRFGSVLKCDCCGRLELRYLDVHIIVSEEEFNAMRGALTRLEAERAKHPQTTGWRLTTYEDGRACPVQYAAVDVVRLHTLVEGAAAVIELAHVLSECSIATTT